MRSGFCGCSPGVPASAPLVVAAYAFVWLALGGYVLSVARRLTSVQREVDRLEADVRKGTRA